MAEGVKPAAKTPVKKAAKTPSKKAASQAKTPKPKQSKNDERVDAVRDRELKRKYVGKKISVDYAEEGWVTGVITWYNKDLKEYRIKFKKDDDYITEKDINGIDAILLD